MTDIYSSSTNGSPTPSNNIARVGRVASTVELDIPDIKTRRANARTGSSFYQGPIDDQHVEVYQGDLLFTIRGPNGNNTQKKRGGSGELVEYVFTTFNGAFNKKMTLSEIEESIEFQGIASTPCPFQSKGPGADSQQGRQFTSQIGGPVTVMHTGTKRICNGDTVAWQAPPQKGGNNGGVRGSDRI